MALYHTIMQKIILNNFKINIYYKKKYYLKQYYIYNHVPICWCCETFRKPKESTP